MWQLVFECAGCCTAHLLSLMSTWQRTTLNLRAWRLVFAYELMLLLRI